MLKTILPSTLTCSVPQIELLSKPIFQKAIVIDPSQNDLKRKIKPIPRKISQIPTNSRYDLRMLRKKNIKTKALEITNNNSRLPKNQFINISRGFSDFKRLAKYWANIYHLRINNISEEDFSCLNKLQHKFKSVRSFQTDRITLTHQKNQKSMQRFLLKCKYLQSYKADLEVKISATESLRNQESKKNAKHPSVADKKENISLKLLSQRASQYQNYNKPQPQRLLISLRRLLCFLTSLDNNKHSTSIAINAVYDKEKKRLDTKTIQRFYPSLCVASYLSSKIDVCDILSAFNQNQWGVQIDLEMFSVSRKDCQKVIEELLSRKNSKISILPSSFFSWPDLVEVLNFSQRMLCKYGSCFSLPNFNFYFHSPPEVKQALADHFSSLDFKWEKVSLRLSISSLDYLNDEKRIFLENMLNEMLEEKNLEKYSQVVFEVNMKNAPPEELFIKISREIVLLIERFIRSLKEMKVSKRCILKIHAQIEDENDTLFFLNRLLEIPNRVDSLEMEFNFQELIRDFEEMKLGIRSRLKNFDHSSRPHWLAEKARKGIWAAENLRKSLAELSKQKIFEDFEILQQKDLELLRDTLKRNGF